MADEEIPDEKLQKPSDKDFDSKYAAEEAAHKKLEVTADGRPKAFTPPSEGGSAATRVVGNQS